MDYKGGLIESVPKIRVQSGQSASNDQSGGHLEVLILDVGRPAALSGQPPGAVASGAVGVRLA